MPLIDSRTLVAMLSPPFDQKLTQQLIDEFVSLERRYILRDWEPAELDGGQFCEILARILYHLDAGNLDPTRDFSDCARYIENENVTHALSKSDARMLIAVLRLVH